jgi:hypothetical protein
VYLGPAVLYFVEKIRNKHVMHPQGKYNAAMVKQLVLTQIDLD